MSAPNIEGSANLNVADSAPSGGTNFGQSASDLLGFWGATPIAQSAQAPAGNVHTPTVGATTSVFVNTTFDGSIGSTAYTVGDIVAVLKTIGILKS